MLEIGIQLCSDKKGNPIFCRKCNERMIKNLNDSTTYFPTHIGIIPMSWCPCCGRMIPLVQERDIDYISNNTKKRVAVRIATSQNRGYKEMKQVVIKLRMIDDKQRFASRFSSETGISIETVLSCC